MAMDFQGHDKETFRWVMDLVKECGLGWATWVWRDLGCIFAIEFGGQHSYGAVYLREPHRVLEKTPETEQNIREDCGRILDYAKCKGVLRKDSRL